MPAEASPARLFVIIAVNTNMKSIYALRVWLAACCFILSGGIFAALRAQNSYLIVPGIKVGAITRTSGEAQLKRIYGRRNVRDAEVDLGEGETEKGTVIYPDDSAKTIWIVWKDAPAKRFPKWVQLTGESPSVWKTRHGIGLGTNLKQLERINGRAFELLGFGWDYAGTIVSWKGGKLEREFGKDTETITIRLSDRTNRKVTLTEEESVVGDREFSSRNRVMQLINPRIYQIIVNFP